MKKALLIPIAIISMLYACGPNAEQKAAMQKSHDDSVAKATAAKQRHYDDSVQAKKVEITQNKNLLNKLQDSLEHAKADLVVAHDQMNNITSFQFGRTHSEREAEISNQTLTIEHLQDKIKDFEGRINEIKVKLNQ